MSMTTRMGRPQAGGQRGTICVAGLGRVAAAGAAILGAMLSPGLAAGQSSGPVATAGISGWSVVLPESHLEGELGGKDMFSVEFLTRHVGWAVGHGSPEHTFVFRTSDGGETWERVPLVDGSSHGETFRAVRFSDALHGWIAGDRMLLRTTDGGESWEPHEPADHGLWARALLPVGPDGLLVGSNDGWVRATADGGGTWHAVQLPGSGSEQVNAFAHAGGNTFFAVTGSPMLEPGGLYRSDDGGRTWAEVLRGKPTLHGIAFQGDRGIVVGEKVAYWSEDRGATWKRVMGPGERNAVAFIGDGVAISVGKDPDVAITENGGRSWRALYDFPEYLRFTDVAVVDGGAWFLTAWGVTAVHRFVDPDHFAPLAHGRVPLPDGLQSDDGRPLPAGLYDLLFGHRGSEHVLRLEYHGPGPEQAEAVDPEGDPVPECDPCVVSLPVDAEYAPDAASEEEDWWLRLAVEPTETGIAVVVDAGLRPPRDLSLAFATLGLAEDTDTDAGTVAKKAGGLFGRVRRAAAGDVRNAVQGANVRAAADRRSAASSAPVTLYRVRIRHALDVIPGS